MIFHNYYELFECIYGGPQRSVRQLFDIPNFMIITNKIQVIFFYVFLQNKRTVCSYQYKQSTLHHLDCSVSSLTHPNK
jgi:hypothetical protein